MIGELNQETVVLSKRWQYGSPGLVAGSTALLAGLGFHFGDLETGNWMWNSDLCPMPHTKAWRLVKGIWRRCGQAWPLIGLIALYLHLHTVIDCKSCCVQCGLGGFIEFATAFCGERCYYKWEMVCVIFIRWPGFTGISSPGTLGMMSAVSWKSRTLGTQPRCHPQRVQRHLGLQEPRNGGLSTSLSFVRGYFLMPLWYWICRDCNCFFQWCCQSLILYDFMVVSFFQFHLKFYAYVYVSQPRACARRGYCDSTDGAHLWTE